MKESVVQQSMEEIFEAFASSLSAKRSIVELKSLQDLAWTCLNTVGFPSKQSEAFQYVSLSKLTETLRASHSALEPSSLEGTESFILPESQNSCIVFVDGVFCPEKSKIPSSIVVLSLSQALQSSYSSFLKHRMQLLIQNEKDPFALLNMAISEEGTFIYVPPKVELLEPLQILHIQTDPALSYVGFRVHCFLGAQARVKMVSSFETIFQKTKCSTFYNDLLDLSLEEGAQCSHCFYAKDNCSFWGFSSFRASLKKDSSLLSLFAAVGTLGLRRDYFISLLGEGASVDLRGLSALNSSKEAHVHVLIDHSAPNCLSKQLFKQVLTDNSRASFTGKIHVKKAAQKTEAYQLNQNLLLSDLAIVNTKPNLEIFADDVKASHGATVSELDEEALFYLTTRGIPSLEAKSLLTTGFCQEILDHIPISSIREVLGSLCRRFLLKTN
jgi:Fe-S cluster assembly protein SufD